MAVQLRQVKKDKAPKSLAGSLAFGVKATVQLVLAAGLLASAGILLAAGGAIVARLVMLAFQWGWGLF